MRVKVEFELDINTRAWCGADVDTMTTGELTREVNQLAEEAMRRLCATKGLLK